MQIIYKYQIGKGKRQFQNFVKTKNIYNFLRGLDTVFMLMMNIEINCLRCIYFKMFVLLSLFVLLKYGTAMQVLREGIHRKNLHIFVVMIEFPLKNAL